MKRWLDHRVTRRSLAMIVLLGAWELAARLGVLDPFYAPPPSSVAKVLAGLFADGQIWPHLEATNSPTTAPVNAKPTATFRLPSTQALTEGT